MTLPSRHFISTFLAWCVSNQLLVVNELQGQQLAFKHSLCDFLWHMLLVVGHPAESQCGRLTGPSPAYGREMGLAGIICCRPVPWHSCSVSTEKLCNRKVRN